MAALAALVVAAACTESGTEPLVSSRSTGSTPISPFSAPTFNYASAGRFGALNNDFTLTSAGGSFTVGGGLFTLNFPQNSVCDPDQSSYGDDQWDMPCVTLSDAQSIPVHAVVVLGSNGLSVDFTPHLRFSPDQTVTISTDIFSLLIRSNRSFFASNPSTLRPLALEYSPTLGGDAVADYVSDPSLITHIDLTTGRIWRRVKHFSGYSQTSGLACDPSPDDPDCIEVDDVQP